jgi:2-hydroxy-3-keto-5-methylthiopentenyl-1-phosphate phosphatase
MCISTIEALHTIKTLIDDDVDECCEALMDKTDVTIKLEKLKKYIEKINEKENPVDLHSALEGYY